MKTRRRKAKTVTTPNPATRPLQFALLRVFAAVAVLCLVLSTAERGMSSPAVSDKTEKPYALIYGTVYGPDDHTIYGVKIKIRQATEKKARWEHYSDHAGEFAQRVPAGKADYVIWADLKGYKSPQYKSLQAGPEVTVHIENDERTDVSLHLKK